MPRLTLLQRLVLLVVLEGALLTGLGVVYAVASAVGHPKDRTGAELAALFAVLTGVGLLLLARGTHRQGSWATTPTVVLNIIALPVGYGLVQGGVGGVGLPLLLVAATVLYLFATPDVRAALRDAED